MEKHKAHYPLTTVKQLVVTDKVRATKVALVGANELGLDFDGMLAVVAALTNTEFYKSMTTYADHTIWQDVYRVRLANAEAYIKLTVQDDLLIVSFKEL